MKKPIKIVLLCIALLLIIMILPRIITVISGGCLHQARYGIASCTTSTTCMECGEVLTPAFGHSYVSATDGNTMICSRCGEQYVETTESVETTNHDPREEYYNAPLENVSEWGFDNLEEMGYGLVEINAFGRHDDGGMYVEATGFVYKFENGYMFRQGVAVENGSCVFGHTNDPRAYRIANNDNLDIDNGWTNFDIDERKTSNIQSRFVAFVHVGGPSELYMERWFVPYSLIDWDKGGEVKTITDGDREDEVYILHIVP